MNIYKFRHLDDKQMAPLQTISIRLLGLACLVKIIFLLHPDSEYRYLSTGLEIMFVGNLLLCCAAVVSSWIASSRDDQRLTVLATILSFCLGRYKMYHDLENVLSP